MRILLFVLCLAFGVAHAQSAPPPCFPLINGTHGIAPRLLTGQVGQHVFWFCSPRGGPPLAYGFSCVHGQCSYSALQTAHNAILRSSAKLGAAQAAYREHIQFECPDVMREPTQRGELCRERDALLKSLNTQP